MRFSGFSVKILDGITRKGLVAASVSSLVLFAFGCARAIPLPYEGVIGPAVLATGQTRTGTIGTIYPVTQVVVATSGNPYANKSDLPFKGLAGGSGAECVASSSRNYWLFGETAGNDCQAPFYFSYSYPPNNYKFADAHLVIDTQRDGSDTEGIFVDGILSGSPPTSMINTASQYLTHAVYTGNTSGYAANTYFNTWSVAHYKQLTRNTMDLDIANLVTPTTVTALDVINDGAVVAATGDDSPVFQAYLVVNGYTISGYPLSCVSSDTYTFQNIFLHNDGNTIGQAAFSGTVYTPFTSWTSGATFHSAEWNYDAALPRVKIDNVDITTATITMNVKRNTSSVANSAIVVNGIGADEGGFNRTQATAAVENWDADASTYWSTFVSAVPATNTSTAVTLNLVSLLGATQLRSLLSQGKLNISLAGSMAFAQGSAATSSRAVGTTVSGPELNIAGTYFNEICTVPYDARSPLTDSAPTVSGPSDVDPPVVNSQSAAEITSTTAVIQWLTDEGASTQVGYGIGNTATLSANDATLSSFHRVTLTGLQPYKVYSYKVISADGNGNTTTSATKTFQTLR